MTFDKYISLKVQVLIVDLFKYCYSLSSFHEGKKVVTWFYTFSQKMI
jgi:hypothetical protein